MNGTTYQRKFLRAPYRREVLFLENDFVFKAVPMNISEGGMLLDSVGHFPETDQIQFMAHLPQFPYFKNYSMDKVYSFSRDHLEGRVVRFTGSLARKEARPSPVEGIQAHKIGIEFLDIKPFDQKKISQYVEVFSSNLIHLLVLLDTVNDQEDNLIRLRKIATILGYDGKSKLAQLRIEIEHDYKSLQW